MPRFVNDRRFLSYEDRFTRLNRYYSRTKNNVWIDPYPEVPGSRSEKMVYAELAKRKIPFQFQDWFRVPEVVGLGIEDWLRPDFILPGLKIMIEVRSLYWSLKPDQLGRDALKQALLEASGYQVIVWFDTEIESRLQDLFNENARLAATNPVGSYVMDKVGRPAKQLNIYRKGVRTRMKKRSSLRKVPTRYKVKVKATTRRYR